MGTFRVKRALSRRPNTLRDPGSLAAAHRIEIKVDRDDGGALPGNDGHGTSAGACSSAASLFTTVLSTLTGCASHY